LNNAPYYLKLVSIRLLAGQPADTARRRCDSARHQDDEGVRLERCAQTSEVKILLALLVRQDKFIVWGEMANI
jgi:hypothetical protein